MEEEILTIILDKLYINREEFFYFWKKRICRSKNVVYLFLYTEL